MAIMVPGEHTTETVGSPLLAHDSWMSRKAKLQSVIAPKVVTLMVPVLTEIPVGWLLAPEP